jgi:hypothetical protein
MPPRSLERISRQTALLEVAPEPGSTVDNLDDLQRHRVSHETKQRPAVGEEPTQHRMEVRGIIDSPKLVEIVSRKPDCQLIVADGPPPEATNDAGMRA